MNKSKVKKVLLWLIAVMLLSFVVIGLINPLSVSEVHFESDKIENKIKIALVSDLHSCKYGEGQSKLVDVITKNNPDIICLTGDIFDDKRSNDNAEIFISKVSSKFSCYYVTGNHEWRASKKHFDEMMEILDKYKVTRLENEIEEININDQTINIMGAHDPSSGLFDLSFAENANKEYFSILLSHRPELLDEYSKLGIDLVLCGHAHGGQWRIPWVLDQGIIAPNQGIFPKYTNGAFEKGNTTMVVSRGLAKESTMIPRFYNRPEVVMIEID